MKRALSEYVIKGITTNIRYLRAIVDHPEFVGGNYDTSFLPRNHSDLIGVEDPHLAEIAMLASAVYAHQRDSAKAKQIPVRPAGAGLSPWRLAGRRPGRR
jgi:acetyl-CoA carboxylase biotin carboxylase subunit